MVGRVVDPYARDAQVAQIAGSIREFGFLMTFRQSSGSFLALRRQIAEATVPAQAARPPEACTLR